MAKEVCLTCGGTGVAPNTRSRVEALLAEGISQAQIARDLGISRARVGQLKQALESASK